MVHTLYGQLKNMTSPKREWMDDGVCGGKMERREGRNNGIDEDRGGGWRDSDGEGRKVGWNSGKGGRERERGKVSVR